MGPIQAIRTCFAKSFDFSGRAGRAEFWWFGLFQIVMVLLAFGLDVSLLGIDLDATFILMPITELVLLVLLVPCIAVSMRRLRDCGWPTWPAPVAIAGLYLSSYAVLWMQETAPLWIDQIDIFLLILNLAIVIAALFPGTPGPTPEKALA